MGNWRGYVTEATTRVGVRSAPWPDPATFAERPAGQPQGVLGSHQLSPRHVTQRANLTLQWVAKHEELLGREIPYYMLQPPQKPRNSSYKINQMQA